jgi:hypothetical protein
MTQPPADADLVNALLTVLQTGDAAAMQRFRSLMIETVGRVGGLYNDGTLVDRTVIKTICARVVEETILRLAAEMKVSLADSFSTEEVDAIFAQMSARILQKIEDAFDAAD